jgi:uncharacterized membrane protein
MIFLNSSSVGARPFGFFRSFARFGFWNFGTMTNMGEGQVGKSLILLDIAVVVRQQDGSFTFDQQSFPVVGNILTCAVVGFLAGLAVGAPLTGATVGALAGGVGSAASASAAGIDPIFVREVESVMKPGTSTLFVLDNDGNMDVILHASQGLGGPEIGRHLAGRAERHQHTAGHILLGQPTFRGHDPVHIEA